MVHRERQLPSSIHGTTVVDVADDKACHMSIGQRRCALTPPTHVNRIIHQLHTFCYPAPAEADTALLKSSFAYHRTLTVGNGKSGGPHSLIECPSILPGGDTAYGANGLCHSAINCLCRQHGKPIRGAAKHRRSDRQYYRPLSLSPAVLALWGGEGDPLLACQSDRKSCLQSPEDTARVETPTPTLHDEKLNKILEATTATGQDLCNRVDAVAVEVNLL
ncbi:hypothetical protein NDU88_006651 [Pleurodeles waltl]|uniref:Uncharacterized protein n=1 Tax=Pleurodeles waltl TaxID=8319 RepID=A0AAV7LQ84_PLEWA|nr:hypothetical protein NDU88_006651 [Pleurodeles waltl]